MNRRCLLLAGALMVVAPSAASAQRIAARFDEGAPVAELALAQPGIASSGAAGSVFGGMTLGALTGVAAAIPITTCEFASCAECMIAGIAVPVFGLAGALVGSFVGATLGLLTGVVVTVAGSYLLYDRWDHDAPDEPSNATDALVLGMSAPLATIAGMTIGALVDRRGGDLVRASDD